MAGLHPVLETIRARRVSGAVRT